MLTLMPALSAVKRAALPEGNEAWYVTEHKSGTIVKAVYLTTFASDDSLYVTAATSLVVIVGSSHGSSTVTQIA